MKEPKKHCENLEELGEQARGTGRGRAPAGRRGLIPFLCSTKEKSVRKD